MNQNGPRSSTNAHAQCHVVRRTVSVSTGKHARGVAAAREPLRRSEPLRSRDGCLWNASAAGVASCAEFSPNRKRPACASRKMRRFQSVRLPRLPFGTWTVGAAFPAAQHRCEWLRMACPSRSHALTFEGTANFYISISTTRVERESFCSNLSRVCRTSSTAGSVAHHLRCP